MTQQTAPPADQQAVFQQVTDTLLTELLGARQAVTQAVPKPGTGPDRYREALLTVRGHMDRVEELVNRAMVLHGALARQAKDAQDTLDTAWARCAQAGNRASARQGAEMQGPRERYAEYDLATLEHKTALRRIERWRDQAAEVLEVARLRLRGIDGTRQDLIAVLRALAFETTLER